VTWDKSVVFYGYSSFFPPIKLTKILLKVKVALNSINQTKPLFAYCGVQHILCCVFYLVCLRIVSCVSGVASFSALSIFDFPFGIL
jgi:hypothetical protein